MKPINQLIRWVKLNPLFIIILIVGAAARCIALGSIPPGLNQDEASIGYEAYSILHYGIDRNGVRLPIHLIAWGSGQNALYAYLSMPFILLFGLNVFSIRIVSVLFGVLGITLFYAISRRLMGSKRGAAIAAFLIAISPWHMMMSRWALESNLFPTLVLLAVWFLLKSLEQPSWLAGFTISLALSLYAYGTAYFFVPLFAAGLFALLAAKRAIKLGTLIWNGALLAIMALPIALFVLINRFDWPSIQTLLFTIPKLTEPRVEQVSSIFGSGGFDIIWNNFGQFLKLFATHNDGLPWNSIPERDHVYPILFIFTLVGIVYIRVRLARQFCIKQAILALWFVIAVLMAFITDVNINRINIIYYPAIMLGAIGLDWLTGRARLLLWTAVCGLSLLFASFCSYYFTDYPNRISPSFFESFGEAVQYASDATDGSVHITNAVNMPYIYVLFYERIDPHHFLDTVQYSNPGGAFQQVSSFGRYTFQSPSIVDGERAAYIFPNYDVPVVDEGRYEVKPFKHYTVISAR